MDKIEINNLNEDDVEEMTHYALKEGGCTVCGYTMEPIRATGTIGENDDIEMIYVCDFCMKVGQWDDLLEQHAEDLEYRAKKLRELIGKLVVMPDDQAWRDACEAFTTENRRQHLRRLNEQGSNFEVK